MAFKSLKILIAPMDWGWGHTTRCVPIAEAYYRAGHQIFFAGNELQIDLFSKNCPFVTPLILDGYNVTYPKHGALFMMKMMSQLPKIKNAIAQEQRWIKDAMRTHHFDVIISDNRYGLYHADAQSIIMTHQLHIQTGAKLSNWVLKEYTKTLLNKFNYCWVVDDDKHSLAGKLSSSIDLNIPLRYIGWLSQFQNYDHLTPHPLSDKTYALAILSGPETMRTQLEHLLLRQMAAQKADYFVLIGGTTTIPGNCPDNVYYIPLATKDEIYQWLQHCKYVISRSGYSTVMDIIFMKKPAVFIPTPGQTEQLLVAASVHEQQGINYVTQAEFRLDRVIPNAPKWTYKSYLPKL